MDFVSQQLATKPAINRREEINLRQHLDDNETFMQQIQLIIYVCTYRPIVYNKIQLQLDELLVAVRKVCLF